MRKVVGWGALAVVCGGLVVGAWRNARPSTQNLREMAPTTRPSSSDGQIPLDDAIPHDLQDVLDAPDGAALLTLVTTHLSRPPTERVANLARLDLGPARRTAYVTGEVELNADETRRLVDSFKAALIAGERTMGYCFEPHHALRLTRGQRTVTFVICFLCRNYLVLPGGAYNNVKLDTHVMEATWLDIARQRGLPTTDGMAELETALQGPLEK